MMMSTSSIPMPPLELRTWVGPTDTADFDNPSGTPIYAEFGIPLENYETVFDFGCGCGRLGNYSSKILSLAAMKESMFTRE